MEEKKLKKNLIKTTKEVDIENGKLIETVETVYYQKASGERSFIKSYGLFLDVINGSKLRNGMLRTYLNLASLMNYDNEVVIDCTNRDMILKLAGITKKSLENHLKVLLKDDFLRRIKRGRYMVNPNYLAKGIEKIIRDLEIKYESLKKVD